MSFLQFSQNPLLKNFMLKTAGTVLAEASPYDSKWGIGLAADHPDAKRRKMWRGRNLLGEVLMEVRDELQANINDGTSVQHCTSHYVDNFLCILNIFLNYRLNSLLSRVS